MNKRILQLVVAALIVQLSPFTLRAQFKYEEYKQMYLGWMKIYNYKGATKTVTIDNKTYTIAQLSIADSFANWMQASYTPKGALGDIIKFLSPKKGERNGNQYNPMLPHSYGAKAISYVFLKKVNGKFIPDNNLGNHWSINANEIPLSYRLTEYNTNEVCLFTFPEYNLSHTDEKQEFELYRLPPTSSASKYIHTVLPKSGSVLRINQVILSRNNIFPFVQLTIGEVLDHLKTALSFRMEEYLAEIRANNIGRTNEIATQSGYVKQRFEKINTTYELLKEKYRSKRNELAFAKTSIISELENGYDIFTGLKLNENGSNRNSLNPVLKVKPEFEKLCSSNKPQWITIKWWGGEMHDEVYKHMHESIINNFDFDYVYNFFFDPEKVKGKPYKPLRSPVYEAKVVTTEKSAMAKKTDTDPSVFYFDDFSTTAKGQTPVGWTSTLNALSKKAIIKTPEGETGNWVEINGQTIHINELGKSLPPNFTMSFDACVKKDFQWGVPGLQIFLVGNKLTKYTYENEIELKIRPGFSGREGWANCNIKIPSKKSYQQEVAIPGFSNDKPINKVKVEINKKGTQLTIRVNNIKMFEQADVFLTNTVFDHFYFHNSRAGWDVEEFYITNIKIKKEE